MRVARLHGRPGPRAQDAYPSKPVHILVPFPAGGAVDIVARTLADELGKRWPVNVIIDNRPGAGGVIAAEATAKAPPDGYTLIVVASGHAIVPYLYPKLPTIIFSDFTPISLLGTSPNLVLVRADFTHQDARRPDRAGARQAGPAQLRPCRQRHLPASGDRTLEGDRQDRHHLDSLQGRRPGAQRSHGRAHSGARPFDQRLNRDSERCQLLVNDVLDDGMVGAEIVMGQLITHLHDRSSADFRRCSKEGRIEIFHRLANLHQPSPTCVVDP